MTIEAARRLRTTLIVASAYTKVEELIKELLSQQGISPSSADANFETSAIIKQLVQSQKPALMRFETYLKQDASKVLFNTLTKKHDARALSDGVRSVFEEILELLDIH